MGWGDCGTDSEGRPIGYVFPATCDHPGCNEEIDRGLSYACGDMHGTTFAGCEGYFCEKHRQNTVIISADEVETAYETVCDSCARQLLASGEWVEDIEEGLIVRNFNLITHLRRQREFSLTTFGPGYSTGRILDHIRKELTEIESAPKDLEEWIDLIMLACDGAWRAGYSPEQITGMLERKLTKNEQRDWPDWREADPNKAIEHIK